MIEVQSAATMMCALLQTAGMVAQGMVLQDFEAFFSSGGQLIFVIGGIGAVISTALFGSYRSARYLLLAPAFYWTLVGITSETQGAIWKLGGGDPRTQYGAVGSAEEAAQSNIEILEQARAAESDAPEGIGPIRVAMVFNWFTGIIDSLVNQSVDIILAHENDEDLLFIARAHALEAILSARPTSPELVGMFEGDGGLLRSCPDMVNGARALGNPAFTRSPDETTNSNDYYQAQFDNGKARMINPNNETFDFMLRNRGGGASQTLIERFMASHPDVNETNLGAQRDMFTLNCGELWEVNRQAFGNNAEYIYRQIEEKFARGVDNDPAGKERLCKTLAFKLGEERGAAGTCELREVIGSLLLRNALTDPNLPNRMEQVFANDQRGLLHASPGQSAIVYEENGTTKRIDGRVIQNGQSSIDGQVMFETMDGNRMRIPAEYVVSSAGHMDAAFGEGLARETSGVRQMLFSYALNLPYWQGVCLYLIALAYPFCALCVLVPGRAMAFLNIPLAWLWVKSWDVGFAIVQVVEKVLWNLLPPVDLTKLSSEELSVNLQGAFQSDPLYNIYSYYYLLSMMMLAVPAVTGAITIKSKKAILSNFTGGAQQAARESQELGEGAYGIERLASYPRKMSLLQGQAAMGQMNGLGKSGINGQGGRAGMGASQAIDQSARAALNGGTPTGGGGGGGASMLSSVGGGGSGSGSAAGGGSGGVGGGGGGGAGNGVMGPRGMNGGASTVSRWADVAHRLGGTVLERGSAGQPPSARVDRMQQYQANFMQQMFSGPEGAAFLSAINAGSNALVQGANGKVEWNSVYGSASDALKALMQAQVKQDTQLAAAFNEVLGRVGAIPVNHDATAGSQDGGGGFEVLSPDIVLEAYKQAVDLYITQASFASDAMVNIASAGAGMIPGANTVGMFPGPMAALMGGGGRAADGFIPTAQERNAQTDTMFDQQMTNVGALPN